MFSDPNFLAKLAGLETRYSDVCDLLGQPAVIANRAEFQKLSREQSHLADLTEAIARRRRIAAELDETRGMLRDGDAELRELARDEGARLERELAETEQRLKLLLLPRDPADAKNILLEVRAGTGGDEAALFAGDLHRMYMRFAERRRWRCETLSVSPGAAGGFKEVIVLIEGKDVFSQLKFESGVHRVQRVPATESAGRIHTSVATVVVLPEAEEIDVKIADHELRIDVMRAGGPGGQSVNTTDSAVRLTHLPSGLIVVCMDEKSQHKNKAKAMKILRSRLFEIERERQEKSEREARRLQVKSGDRSDKIRTYNFPQDRMTDHRIGLTKHNLEAILDGDLDDSIDAVRAHFQAEALREAAAG